MVLSERLVDTSRKYSFLAYPLITIIIYLFFYQEGFFSFIPKSKSLVIWDASWYSDLKDNGYLYSEDSQSNSGFFPLFSYLWRFTHLNAIGISIFNYIIFITSFIWLIRKLNLSRELSLIYPAIPSVMFFYIPYTESVFFACCAILLVGLKENNRLLTASGFFLASLTRSASIFFIPAVIAMELILMNFNSKENIRNSVKNVLAFSFASFIGQFLVIVFNYLQTGVWFAYAKAQMKFWEHTFRIPKIPFNTWGGNRVLWLDGLSLVLGIIFILAIIIIAVISLRAIFKKQDSPRELPDKPIIFSLIILSITTLYVILFNNEDHGLTSLNSLNRYVICTAFFPVALNYLASDFFIVRERLHLLWIVVISFILLLNFHLKWIPEASENRVLATVYLVLLFAYYSSFVFLDKMRNQLFLGFFIMLNLLLQVKMFYNFISLIWIA